MPVTHGVAGSSPVQTATNKPSLSSIVRVFLFIGDRIGDKNYFLIKLYYLGEHVFTPD